MVRLNLSLIFIRAVINKREHRKFFVKKSKNYERELESIKRSLKVDNKNYHCFAYRIWLCKEFDLYQIEKENVEEMIEEDVGNNSAWSYRFFLYKGNNHELALTDDQINEHIQYVSEKLKLWPGNEAAWNYLNAYFLI